MRGNLTHVGEDDAPQDETLPRCRGRLSLVDELDVDPGEGLEWRPEGSELADHDVGSRRRGGLLGSRGHASHRGQTEQHNSNSGERGGEPTHDAPPGVPGGRQRGSREATSSHTDVCWSSGTARSVIPPESSGEHAVIEWAATWLVPAPRDRKSRHGWRK